MRRQAGYYCSSGVRNSCGGNQYYCPGGTSTRSTVSSGYYSTGGGSSTRTGQSPCEVGANCCYCVYRSRTSLTPSLHPRLQAGYYCSSGVKHACGGNEYYCPGQTSSPVTVSTGYYSNGGTSSTRSGQVACQVRAGPALRRIIYCLRRVGACVAGGPLLRGRCKI